VKEHALDNFKINGITPFLPAKDFELSKRFYAELGFEVIAKIDNAVRLEIEGYGFWLQDYYVEEWANNTMLCIYVEDLNEWNQRLESINWEENYGSLARIINGPHEQEGALMMQVGDPAGVLWHIRQNP
jgi:catechol 2,3-dioxygenase-like lactoylglutathione lyase family enzyme